MRAAKGRQSVRGSRLRQNGFCVLCIVHDLSDLEPAGRPILNAAGQIIAGVYSPPTRRLTAAAAMEHQESPVASSLRD